ncbi:MAG: HEAT repeat domain-containing protein [Phycisphaerae bacterium]|nr:HEAT repeat domain-containing protein [Phycisphaerae bacterium]
MATAGILVGVIAVVAGIAGGIYYYWSRYTIRGNLWRLGTSWSSKVIAAATRALDGLCDKRAVPILLKRLRKCGCYDSRIREVIARILGRLGDPQAIEPLLELLANHYRDVRLAAREALNALGATREQLTNGYLRALSNIDSYGAKEVREALDALGATKEQLVNAYLKGLLPGCPWCAEALTVLGLTQEQRDKLAEDLSRVKDARYNTISDLLHNLGDPRGSMIYVFHPEEGHDQEVSHEAEIYDGYTGPLYTQEHVVDHPAYWEGPVPREQGAGNVAPPSSGNAG